MKLLHLFPLTLLLTSCVKDPLMDLKQFVKNSQLASYSVTEKTPVFSTIEPLKFSTNYVREPFSKFQKNDLQQVLEPSTELVLDLTERMKEPLENYSLSELFMQGTLLVDKTMWGVIESKNGELFMVKEGSYIGFDQGIVLKVLTDEIDIIERFLKLDNKWEKIPTKILLNLKKNRRNRLKLTINQQGISL